MERRSVSPLGRAGARGVSPVRTRRASSVDPNRPVSAQTRRPPVPAAREFPPLPGLPPLPLDALSTGVEIGKGRFKQVHCGVLKGSAVKEAEADHDIVVLRYAKGKSECKTELQVLSRLAQQTGIWKFVPRLFGACDQGRDLIVVQERATQGSLKSVLTCENSIFTSQHGLRAAAQLSAAMDMLQSARVVHADLSCRNILVSSLDEAPDSIQVKVTDFGLSAVLKEGSDFEHRKQPTATRWCSPETIAFQKLSHKADVWSLGALFWEMFSLGESPWLRFQKRSDVAAKLKSLAEDSAVFDPKEDFPRQNGYPQAAHDLLWSCLQVPEQARPGFPQLQASFERLFADKAQAEALSEAEEDFPTASPDTSTVKLGKVGEAMLEPAYSTEVPVPSDAGTLSTSATPTVPSAPAMLCRNKKHEERLAELLAEQEARLARLIELERTEMEEQRHRRLSAPCKPFRENITHLSVHGVPQNLAEAGVITGGSGAWTLQSIVGPGLLRKQEFLDKEDAWFAFIQTADAAQPCHLRDPKGRHRASSSWVGIDQVVRAQQAVPIVPQTHRLAAWMPSTAYGTYGQSSGASATLPLRFG